MFISEMLFVHRSDHDHVNGS